jgi:hypothetical protein
VKFKLCFLLLGIAIMLGCSATARFYPVQGSLSAQTPLPVLVGKVTGVPFTPKGISVVLSDGEVCKGHWVIVHPVQVPKGATTATAAPTNGMQSVWGHRFRVGVLCIPCAGYQALRPSCGHWEQEDGPERGDVQA